MDNWGEYKDSCAEFKLLRYIGGFKGREKEKGRREKDVHAVVFSDQ